MEFTSQAVRFLIVGAFTNISLYLVYLLITWFGIDHKLAMTLVYMSGVLMGFMLNRNWTFRHHGRISHGFIRYCVMYAVGYFVNLTGLYLLVDIAGYPHQIIQLLIAILSAIIFFVLMRLWVFSDRENEKPGFISRKNSS
jgi:putative flippase GtrA